MKDVVGALVAVGQLGVGQRLGLEAAILAARLFAQDASQQPTQAFLIKLDFKNAFNSVLRKILLKAVVALCARLLGYALAAYGRKSYLFFGAFLLLSAAGAQQGDPLGPLFFAIVYAFVVRACPLVLALRLRAGYLDDVLLGGSLADLTAALAELLPALAAAGLELNAAKSEIVAPPGLDPRSSLGLGLLSSLADFSFLGAPCGTDAEAREHFVAKAHPQNQPYQSSWRNGTALWARASPVLRRFPVWGFLCARSGRLTSFCRRRRGNAHSL